MSGQTKNPVFVESGRRGARKRWGEPVTVRLDQLSAPQRRLVLALVEAAEGLGYRHHLGITATAPGFYGAQGRPIPQLPIRYPDLADDMARQRVMNFEMEASALLVLAGLARCRAGVVCAVYAQRTTGDFVTGAAKDAAEAACVETGLESLQILAGIDRRKQEMATDHWRPSLGI